jgi:uncharacterized protein (DUF1501 family)
MKSHAPSILIPRRSFLRRLGCAGMSTWALTNTIRDLRLINSALAQSGGAPGDYKALVCLFLAGGNDSNNWFVPTDNTTYDAYTTIRGNLALPQSSLLAVKQPANPGQDYMDGDGHTYGFHPSCAELQTLFGEGKLATVLNVGTLVRPITRAEYLANATGTRPPQLFSHSDQVTQWETSIPDQPPATGWGGRIADLMNAWANPSGSISMSISLNGANTFEIGNLVSQYHVSTSGAVTLSGNLMTGTGARVKALRDLLALNTSTNPAVNLQKRAISEVTDRAIATGDLLNTAISPTAPDTFWSTAFPTSGLANQLKMIARLIHARDAFSMKRQIFFCSVGGYDTHTAQVTLTPTPNTTTGTHANLLNDVSEAVFAFQRAMEQLGLSDKVVLFTASDFNRTFPTNSQGSDHGWGGHHIVVGGPAVVGGGRTFGNLPTFAINGPNDTSTGRWIPTLAVDQYSATLAKWFGLSNTNMPLVFPNLSRFAASDLGFLI